MAHERSSGALRVVVLVPRKAVVDDEHRALRQRLDDRAHPRTCLQADFAQVGQRHLDRSSCVEQLTGRWPVRPLQARADAALQDAAVGPMHDVRRNRIDHLVRDHGAVKARGQVLDMLDAIAELFLLPANEVRAGFQDQVFPTVGQHVGERAAAGADLEDAIERAQLARERAAEERAELGRGDEVAARAELARAARVVADARLVQRELHVARERDPAAAGGDLCLDALARLHALESKALMSDSLAGRAVLVTGGARRLGAAIARRLHGAGASVLIHYRDSDADAAKLEAELNAARPKSAGKVKAELLAPIAPRALVAAALDSFGRLDVLVNNASAFFPVGVGEIDLSPWEELSC